MSYISMSQCSCTLGTNLSFPIRIFQQRLNDGHFLEEKRNWSRRKHPAGRYVRCMYRWERLQDLLYIPLWGGAEIRSFHSNVAGGRTNVNLVASFRG